MLTWLTDVALGAVAAELGWAELGWRGLTALGDAPPPRRAAATLALAAFALRRRPRAAALALGAVAQLPLALWRRRTLSPLAFFAPGERPGYRVERHDLPLPDGATVPAVLFAPPAARRALLLIHGAGAHKASYTWPLIAGLLTAGHAVLTIDLDGHGESPRTLRYPAVLQAPAVAVAWLRARFPWVGLVAISMGGCVAARAVADGAAVDGLVLLTAPIRVPYTARMRRREFLTLLQPAAWALHRVSGTRGLREMWSSYPARCAISPLDLIAELRLEETVPQLRCPLLLSYGSLDLIAPPAHARRLARLAPHAQLLIVPGLTHLAASLDARTIRGIVRWLAALPL